MSLFAAVHGAGNSRPPYAEAAYGEITHPTERLIDLLSEVAIRIGGGDDYLKARAVTRLDQGMGGGKSHACIGAYRPAAHPSALFGTELGHGVTERIQSRIGTEIAKDLHATCSRPAMRQHDPVRLSKNSTGQPSVSTSDSCGGCFQRDYTLFERYQPYWSDKHKIAEAIKAVNRPVLIIVDEVLDYVGNGLDGSGRPDLAAQDMAFLRALFDVVNDVPHVALVVVMIASDADKTACPKAAQDRREDLNSLLERNGTPATVTEVGDFADILRRRLFDATLQPRSSRPPPHSTSRASATKDGRDSLGPDRCDLASQVAGRSRRLLSVPPMLMALARMSGARSPASNECDRRSAFSRQRSTPNKKEAKAGQWVPTHRPRRPATI